MSASAPAKWEAVNGASSDEWQTPFPLFWALNAEFHFDLDVCARPWNNKCADFFDPLQDGLQQCWRGRICWMNPPYSRKQIGLWLAKAYEESRAPDTIVVALVHARTDAKWWHRWVMRARELRFIRGRVPFVPPPGLEIQRTKCPSPSVVLVFDQRSGGPPQIRSMSIPPGVRTE